MGKVAAFTIPGVRCWFWSNDHDQHFHAQYGDDWQVKVNFMEEDEDKLFKVEWANKKMCRRHRKALASARKSTACCCWNSGGWRLGMSESVTIVTGNERVRAAYKALPRRLKENRLLIYHDESGGDLTDLVVRHGATDVWYIFQVKDRVPDPVSRLRKMPNVKKRYILFVPPHYPVEAVGGDLSSLGVDNPRKVLLKLEGNEACLLQRLFGIVARGRKDAILDAFWDGGGLEVVNARLERLCVPVEQIPGLAGQSEKELRKFEIDPQGSAIYWPGPDVHYDWKHLTWTVDPSLELRKTGKFPDFYKRYGKAVRAVREAQGRRQSDIPGLSTGRSGGLRKGRAG